MANKLPEESCVKNLAVMGEWFGPPPVSHGQNKVDAIRQIGLGR